jgi:hypothetical protein
VSFVGVTHEFVRPLDAEATINQVEIELLHEPSYDDLAWKTFREKWMPRARVHTAELLADFSTLPKWNYTSDQWTFPMRFQLAHPLLIGTIVTPLFHCKETFKKFLRQPSWFFVRYACITGLYFIYLFHLVRQGRATRS